MEKLVLPNFADMWYSSVLSLEVKDAIMERWQRAFAENDKDFKELFGVKKEIFLQMHDILTADTLERRKKEDDDPHSPPATNCS